jgi:hypothetical protein
MVVADVNKANTECKIPKAGVNYSGLFYAPVQNVQKI